jgi:glycosyltransferase involved in cell wall biosynthesis
MNSQYEEAVLADELNGKKILFLVTEDWYFCSHRLPIARAARNAGAQVIVASRMRHHRSLIEAEGFETRDVPFDRSGLNPLSDLKTLRFLVGLLREERPDLVHNVAAKPVLYGSIAAWVTSVPVVINAMAGLGFLFTAQTLKARLVRRVFQNVVARLSSRSNSRLIVQNHDDRSVFIEAGLASEQIVLIPGSGVDTKRFQASSEPNGTPVAICVSRMLRDKGIEELVAAARILRARNVALVIRLVGGTDANPSSIPQALLDAWAKEGVVEVAGHLSDIAGEYERSHIAVLPSYREGLPKSLLEAAACARPLVTTDVPGCREICVHGENGLLVPSHSPDHLAFALELLARDKEMRKQMGLRGRAFVENTFSATKVQEATLALYRELLAS